MGDMSVAAPTTRLPFGSTTARVRRGIACPRCRSASALDAPFCAQCGARVVFLAPGRGPADLAATRSLQFAALVVGANAIVGAATFGVVLLVADAARIIEAALFLEVIKVLVVGPLAATAIRFGVRGLRDTADGRLRRRGWAIAGIAVAAFFALLVLLSLGLMFALFLGR